jgi:hypothetical protein
MVEFELARPVGIFAGIWIFHIDLSNGNPQEKFRNVIATPSAI